MPSSSGMAPDRLLSVRSICDRDVRFAMQPDICPARCMEVRSIETTRGGSLVLQVTPDQLQKLREVWSHEFKMPSGSEVMPDLKQRSACRSISVLFASAAVTTVILIDKRISKQ